MSRYGEASRSLLRDTILQATDELVASRGWPAVTMAMVAARAGVSRQTVYNEVGGREALAQAYAVWAGNQMLDEVDRSLASYGDDLATALVSTVEMFLENAADHPLVRAVRAATGTNDLLGLVITPEGNGLVHAASARLADIISATWPVVDGDDVALVADTLVRLAISHIVLPTLSPADAAQQVGAALGPLLDQVVARTATS